MRDAFHSQLVAEARADSAALHELGQRMATLHEVLSGAPWAEVEDLHREFENLHDEFEALHREDMEKRVDQSAHRSWRERMRDLTERLDRLAAAR
jgi:hypothetical protein